MRNMKTLRSGRRSQYKKTLVLDVYLVVMKFVRPVLISFSCYLAYYFFEDLSELERLLDLSIY